MRRVDRRAFLSAAAMLGASCVLAQTKTRPSSSRWTELRDRYPQGVASADPTDDSVLLWTRCPGPVGHAALHLIVEVAEDPTFARVVARAAPTATAQADWTCRVLVAGLKPRREYWYRFVDPQGRGSRIGRTVTAPSEEDLRPVRFAFVSCQDCTLGAQNAYRRMIYEDERADKVEQLQFVLHLGDFIYEVVSYPEQLPNGRYDRSVREIMRYPHGEKIGDFHIPTDVEDYRTLYRAYLQDPDIQDARARWPFVNMWDNHEFSWLGWQSYQKFDGKTRPAASRKVAANQAWFEYQPARVRLADAREHDRFVAPSVADMPTSNFDAHGLGQEPGNLAAIGSLTGYRVLRCGRHVELIITDQRSYRSEDPLGRPDADALRTDAFPELIPEEAAQILDAGRAYQPHAPERIAVGAAHVANFRKNEPPQTILGSTQKAWFLKRLAESRATWKIWGNTVATLDLRADLQNLPPGLTQAWPGAGYAVMPLIDFGTAYVERAEIYDWVRDQRITGFVTICGDRHSFCAGLAVKALPPKGFEPVGVAFVTGSISAPGIAEALEYALPKNHPLRALYVMNSAGEKPIATINMLMQHGVRACLEYRRSGDHRGARQLHNPDLAPHLSFLDFGGHGYSVVRATAEWIETEFVCVPRPIHAADRPDGGPIRYRVSHRARRWGAGERPSLEQRILEGDPELSI